MPGCAHVVDRSLTTVQFITGRVKCGVAWQGALLIAYLSLDFK